ncbi:hypothetical protein DBP20_01825 [Streptomyces sp. CS131]|nr:hypothetical protein DBP20_01825 [Streptomyces sp. CS131]
MITTHGGRRHARPPSGVTAMDERQPPHRGGPPWLSRARSRTAVGLPWVSSRPDPSSRPPPPRSRCSPSGSGR